MIDRPPIEPAGEVSALERGGMVGAVGESGRVGVAPQYRNGGQAKMGLATVWYQPAFEPGQGEQPVRGPVLGLGSESSPPGHGVEKGVGGVDAVDPGDRQQTVVEAVPAPVNATWACACSFVNPAT